MSSSIAEIVTMAESLSTEERLDLIVAITNGLKGEPIKPSKKATKKAKEVDPDAPKRETTWWIKATQHVRNTLKPYIQEYNASLGDEGKKMPGTAPVSVAKALKEAGHMSAEDYEVDQDTILKAFETYKDNISADGGSVASKPSKASKTKFSDLSDEEKTEKRKASAAKAAATRKAKKEAEAAATTSAEPKDDVPWMHGGVSYLRIGNNLWEAETDKWVGTWDEATKKINKKAKEPKRNMD
jgi:PHD/YefM family antitoxin component YafN of YafNO toxin-antitoxin module